jgi:urease subunit alpha
MMSSDSQAMGRVGEVIIRTWQTADKMKRSAAPAGGNRRERQFPRPALHRQVHDQPRHRPRHRARDRLDRGRQAGRSRRLVARLLRREAGHGAEVRHDRRRPMGDPNASIPTPQPVTTGPCSAPTAGSSATRRSSSSARPRSMSESATATACEAPGRGARHPHHRQEGHGPERTDAEHQVDPETYEVRADGEVLTCEPATVLPMAQRYFLF